MEWDKWLDLFTVALKVKYSVSIEEVERIPDEQNPRVRALMGDLPDVSANGKVISLMFLSLGEAARKLFKDKFPEVAIWNLTVQEMEGNGAGCFRVVRNRTRDRHLFLSRKQMQGELMQQFWHALNGSAAKCKLGEITTTLVQDVFILNMNDKETQKKLCLEP